MFTAEFFCQASLIHSSNLVVSTKGTNFVPLELLFKSEFLTVSLDDCMGLPIDERVILIVGLTIIVIVVVMAVRVATGRRATNI